MAGHLRKTRRYRSDLRQAQAADTARRILETTGRLLEREGADRLTLPRVAAAARVSVPTVYRHFPDVTALLRAFLDWFRPQIGMTVDRLLGQGPEAVCRLPAENFPRFEAHGALLRALIDSAAFNRVRLPSIPDRAGRAAAMFRPFAPRWPPAELAAAAGALFALGTPDTWRWLRDTWGLDADAARRASLWAMDVLLQALRQGRSLDRALDKSLDSPPRPKPRTARPRKGGSR